MVRFGFLAANATAHKVTTAIADATEMSAAVLNSGIEDDVVVP